VSFSLFGDAGVARGGRYTQLPGNVLLDAGAGLALRGKLYDRNVNVRFDVPAFVNHSSMAGGLIGKSSGGSFRPRWTFTVGDLW
jgi:hypothetical protein